jgi:hypothetical protein
MGEGAKRHKKIRTTLAVGSSVAVHVLVLAAIWGMKAQGPVFVEDPAHVVLELVEPPPPPPDPTPDPAPTGPPAETPTPVQAARTEEAAQAPEIRRPETAPPPPIHRTPPPIVPVETIQVTAAQPESNMRLLGEGQLAGALVAGQGAGGGAGQGGSGGGGSGGSGTGTGCDMLGRLQAMVRRDARVQSTVRQAQQELNAGRRAIQIWDGDWVQSTGQDGRGLAGVRQAIAVEVAFAPRECRMEQVRGLVVLSLGDDAGSPRLALGAPSWRWGELATR